MTKEQYLKFKEETDKAISKLRESLKDAEKKYIDENKPFNIGEAVEVTLKKGGVKKKAFVKGYKLHWLNSTLEIVLQDSKKDGTISRNELSWYKYKEDSIKGWNESI